MRPFHARWAICQTLTTAKLQLGALGDFSIDFGRFGKFIIQGSYGSEFMCFENLNCALLKLKHCNLCEGF